jgi:hypothetical protein
MSATRSNAAMLPAAALPAPLGLLALLRLTSP